MHIGTWFFQAREETELYESCRKQNESGALAAKRNSGHGEWTRENMQNVTLLSNQVKDVRDELNILGTIVQFQMTVQQGQSDLDNGSPPPKDGTTTTSPPNVTDRMVETVAQLQADYSAADVDRHLSDMERTAQRLQDAVSQSPVASCCSLPS